MSKMSELISEIRRLREEIALLRMAQTPSYQPPIYVMQPYPVPQPYPVLHPMYYPTQYPSYLPMQQPRCYGQLGGYGLATMNGGNSNASLNATSLNSLNQN
jgi:hypothetical protein